MKRLSPLLRVATGIDKKTPDTQIFSKPATTDTTTLLSRFGNRCYTFETTDLNLNAVAAVEETAATLPGSRLVLR